MTVILRVPLVAMIISPAPRSSSAVTLATDEDRSGVALIEEFGIANATGQKVMRALRADGLIRTEPGMGSFVTSPEERQTAGD
ncbi:hypothetical protein ABZ297_04070 [Nonomuraea sp. NPDC005983]|uniref:hypothetical protein n=1 Tax=Nonomuraea sp. NPDC005983 TaxID=3155595 RepID=UPI0033A8B05C